MYGLVRCVDFRICFKRKQVLELVCFVNLYMDIYYYKCDYFLLFVLYNFVGVNSVSKLFWSIKFYLNVGFRNYLEYVVSLIGDWV